MAGLSEIEKLKARYDENPEGRYFAPLADAYRKTGRLDEAIELVQQGLTKHPDYLSAHIVLGRCYLDKKDDASARKSFEGVLALDPENIIALKSLAEIGERLDDKLSARRWLGKLLEVDPTNMEAEADLRRLGGPLPAGAEAVAPAPEEPAMMSFADEPPAPEVPPPSVTESDTVPMPAIDLEPPAAAAPAEPVSVLDLEPTSYEPPPAEPAPAAGEIVPFDESLEWGAGERTSRAIHAEDIQAAEATHEATSAAIDFMGAEAPGHLAPPEPDHTADLPLLDVEPTVAAESVWDGAPEDRHVDLDAAGHGEPPPPAADDLPLIMPEDVTPPEELTRPSVKQVATVSPEPEVPEDAGAPLLTETMGDLYLKQGFKTEAADVYRQLLEQRPGDDALRRKLAALEAPAPSLSAAALGQEPLGAWLRRVARASLVAPEPHAPPPPGEPTIMDQAFAEPEPEPVPEPVGEPARPASDAYTLDRVFGAEAPPESGGAAPAAAPGASFDEFFGAPAPAPETARPSQAAAPEGGAPPEGDDLSSFNAWLHGLKR